MAEPDPSEQGMPSGSFRICAVCGYPLEGRHGPDGESDWFHIRPSDHIVVPVLASEIAFNQRCDFCSQEGATEVILAESFIIPGTESQSIGGWAACTECAELVERRRWSQLVTRVKQVNRNIPASRRFLLETYEVLGQHTHGRITQAEWRERMGYRS